MRLKTPLRASLAAAGAIGLGMIFMGSVSAQTPPSVTYTANLAPVPLNGANGASGKLTLVLSGNQATITETASGLASTFMNAPFPHVQHIHGGAAGMCPTASADSNNDKVLTTTEGQPSYGDIQTTLSVSGDTTPAAGTNVMIAPSGASINYSRTITLDAATMASLTGGKAVVVVHGIDPSTAAPAATMPSELVPSLPQAATAPALCGVLVAGASAPAAAGGQPATMRPPTTGDAGLLGSSSTSWGMPAAVFAAALGLAGAGTLAVTRNRSR